MRAYVFTDERLSSHAGQFVWLSIDTERDGNAEAVAKFPISAWPSFLVVDPRSEKIVFRQVGSFTATELTAILDDGLMAMGSRADAAPHEKLLAKADVLYGGGDYGAAAAAYAKALPDIPAKDPSYVRALGAYLFALSMESQHATCATVARDALPKLGAESVGVVAAGGLDCALSLEKDVKERAELVNVLEEASVKGLSGAIGTLSADDVSGIYQVLIGAREDAGDAEGQGRLERDWSAQLDAAAAKAPDAEARAVFDSHRLGAYIAIGQPEKAVVMLVQSEKDLPDDYNPPARLALAYKEVGKYDLAMAASDRALAKVYGPRKLVVLRGRAQIQEAKGDVAGARETLDDAIAFAGTLPDDLGQRWIARLTEQRDALAEKPAAKAAGS